MFKDQITGKQSAPSEKSYKLVTKTRDKIYYNEAGKEIGRGWEIVEEKTVRKDTYNKRNKNG